LQDNLAHLDSWSGDYETGRFLYDVIESGPQVGVTFLLDL